LSDAPTDASPAFRAWRTTLTVVAVAAVVLLIAQAIGWRLDPPRDLPNGIYPRDLWAEGPFKAHEARRWALFGEWSTNDVDNYRFWKVQSPAHVWPLAVWLKTFGVSWSNLRLYSTLTYAVGWLVLLGTAVRLRRDGAAVAVALALVGDFYLRWAARSALIEIPLTSLSCVVFAVAVVALHRPRWVYALPILSTVAILTKQNGVYMGAFSVFASGLVWYRHREHPDAKKAVAAWIGLGTILALGFVMYAFSDEYWRTIEWNANHMLGRDNDRASSLRASYLDPTKILRRLTDPIRWRDAFWFYLPTTLPLGLGFAGWLGFKAATRRPVADDDALAGAMLLLTVAMLEFTHQTRLRFTLVMFPWMWWATGRVLFELVRHYRKAGIAAITISVLAFGATHGRWHLEHAGDPSTDLFDGNAHLADKLTPDDVLVGKTAPWMGFSTKADHFVMRYPFNCTRAAVKQIHPTHILRLSSGDYIRHCLRKVRKDWLRGTETITTIPFKRSNIYLQVWPMVLEDDEADPEDEGEEDDLAPEDDDDGEL